MIHSMTGFGTASDTFKGGRGTLELKAEVRTVNSKFLDVKLKSPRPYIAFDPLITKLVRSKLKRGRVDVSLSLRIIEGEAREVIVNKDQARSVHKALADLSSDLGIKEEIKMQDLLRVPDWIETEDKDVDLEEEWKFVETVVTAALDQVVQARKREGESLQKALEEHRSNFTKAFGEISQVHDKVIDDLRSRVRERIEEIYGKDGFDPQRLEQEIVLMISRSDYREEVDRTTHHLQTLGDLFGSKGEIGRKIEFVLQELQREINTLGTKCSDPKLTLKVVELKSNIERMREQVLNVE